VLISGLLVAVPGVVHDGTRHIAARIEALRRDGDAVLAYRRYPYDLPFLLDARTPLAVVEDWDDPAIAAEDSWRRELWLGRGWRPESQAWLVKPEALPGRCGPGARCFVVAREKDATALRASLRLEELEREGRLVLLASPAAAR
jgi:hypothetical protein